jgi:hypothetical protein
MHAVSATVRVCCERARATEPAWLGAQGALALRRRPLPQRCALTLVVDKARLFIAQLACASKHTMRQRGVGCVGACDGWCASAARLCSGVSRRGRSHGALLQQCRVCVCVCVCVRVCQAPQRRGAAPLTVLAVVVVAVGVVVWMVGGDSAVHTARTSDAGEAWSRALTRSRHLMCWLQHPGMPVAHACLGPCCHRAVQGAHPRGRCSRLPAVNTS